MKRILALIFTACIVFSGCLTKTEYTATEFLMDTVCTITTDSELHAINAFAEIHKLAEETDYFSDTSLVSKLNLAKADEPVRLSERVFYMTQKAIEMYGATNGAFDITTAPLKDVWGFEKGDHAPPSSAEISEALRFTTSRFLRLNEKNKTIVKRYDNVKIDLGAVAKGCAVDAAAKILKNSGAKFGLINFGGAVYAFGKNPNRADGKWEIGIADPNGDGYITTVTIEEGAVVTSGNYQRYFEWEGKKYHHIIDPKDGYPADNGLSSVTIVGDSALVADCLATAGMILDKDEAEALAKRYNMEFIGF